MAILKFGTVVTGLRGTVDGNIFSANKSGPYIRGWAPPSNPRSTKQNSIRSAFSNEAQSWADLTDAQRTDWDILAADPLMTRTNSLGEDYNLSGFQQFQAINLARATVNQAPRVVAPAAASQAGASGIVLTVQPSGSGGSSFTFIEAELDPNRFLVCKLTLSRSPGVTTRSVGFRFLVFLDNTDTTPFTITSEIDSLFGDPIIGYKFFMTAARQSGTGIRSADIQVTDIVS